MDLNNIIRQEGKNPLDESNSEYIRNENDTIDYTDLVEEHAFLGEYPYATIIEGITDQFDDYINNEDPTDYVDIFYDQMVESYKAIDDEEEVHPQEVRDVLDRLKSSFVDFMFNKFQTRLAITIMAVDNEETAEDEVELCLRQCYEFFILNAKKNFKVVIARDIQNKLTDSPKDDTYFETIRNIIDEEYSPLMKHIDCRQFIQYCNDEAMLALFDENQITGNFLRKYSPKLYENDSFYVNLVTYITLLKSFKEEIYGTE